MGQRWYIRLGWWLCEKTGHLRTDKPWFYKGHKHCVCKLCGRIVRTPLNKS